MLLKHYTESRYAVPDPLRPGFKAYERRLEASGTHKMVHDGVEYQADEYGWFDLPEEVGRFWHSRPGWKIPAEVDDEVAFGLLSHNDSPASGTRGPAVASAPKPRKPRAARIQ